MDNKSIILLCILILGLFVSSCKNSESDRTDISFESDTIHYSSVKNQHISVQVNDIDVFSKSAAKLNESLLTLIRQSNANKREIALIASKNNNFLPVRVIIGESIDTILKVEIKAYFPTNENSSIRGNCAQLTNVFAHTDNSIDMKKWLFKRKEHLTEEQIQNTIGIYNELSRNNFIELSTSQDIPVIKSFAGLSYKVNSSKNADYYILYACSSPNEIEDFVGEIIANDFELCSTTLNQPLSCFRASNSNGYKCICLIAIDKDWNYTIEPLALVAIDNVAPSRKPIDKKNIDQMVFPHNIKVHFPKNKPEIYGYADVAVVNSNGNGIACNVTFIMYFSGDVKSITVKRTHELCYYSRFIGYDEETPGPKSFTYMTKDLKSPHTFNIKLHLEDGDNFIPYVIEDNHGNKLEGHIIHRASFSRTDSPIIENNIDIYN